MQNVGTKCKCSTRTYVFRSLTYLRTYELGLSFHFESCWKLHMNHIIYSVTLSATLSEDYKLYKTSLTLASLVHLRCGTQHLTKQHNYFSTLDRDTNWFSLMTPLTVTTGNTMLVCLVYNSVQTTKNKNMIMFYFFNVRVSMILSESLWLINTFHCSAGVFFSM